MRLKAQASNLTFQSQKVCIKRCRQKDICKIAYPDMTNAAFYRII